MRQFDHSTELSPQCVNVLRRILTFRDAQRHRRRETRSLRADDEVVQVDVLGVVDLDDRVFPPRRDPHAGKRHVLGSVEHQPLDPHARLPDDPQPAVGAWGHDERAIEVGSSRIVPPDLASFETAALNCLSFRTRIVLLAAGSAADAPASITAASKADATGRAAFIRRRRLGPAGIRRRRRPRPSPARPGTRPRCRRAMRPRRPRAGSPRGEGRRCGFG